MAQKVKENLISKGGYEKLLKELNDLKKVQLPAVLERLGEAKSLGDLSENFEYKSSLEERDFVNSRIIEVEDLIANAEIIKATKSGPKGVVRYGSIVELELEGGKRHTVKVVGTGEVVIEGDDMEISFQSPIGAAIKDKKIGDKVQMRLNNERKDIKIISVK